MSDNSSQNNNLPAKKPGITDVLRKAIGEADDPRALIDLAKAAAMHNLGLVKRFDSPEEKLVYDANMSHLASISLGRMSNVSLKAFRMQAWEMYHDPVNEGRGKFLLVRIPVLDEKGKPVFNEDGTPEVISFDTFDDWYYFAAGESHMNPTAVSVIRSCVTKLLPFLQNKPLAWTEYVVDQETGKNTKVKHTITIDDIFKIDHSKLEVMMSAVGELLDRLTKTGDKADIAKLTDVLASAQTMTKTELKKKLSKDGLRGKRVNVIPSYTTNLDDGKHVAYMLVLTPEQQRFIEGILDGRLDVLPVDSVDDMPPTVRRLLAEGQGGPIDSSLAEQGTAEDEDEAS
jgi:hypothetical protein